MTTRKLMLSCNLMLTAALKDDGEQTEITIEDARHATIGYATGEQMAPEYKSAVSRKTLALGLRALVDKMETAEVVDGDEEVPALTQKGADA